MGNISQQVVTAAHELFQNGGYQATTLTQLAEKAATPMPDLEAHYQSKEEIVLAMYQTFAQDTLDSIADLSESQISKRYFKVMEDRIAQLQPHYEAMAALFAMAMLPHSNITTTDISPGRRDPMYQAFLQLVQESDDAPTAAGDADDIAMLLYTFHFMILVFWVYDRTKEKQATHLMIDFMGDFFKVMRPMMMMPLFSKAMTKLAKIMMLVFGGARLVEDSDSAAD